MELKYSSFSYDALFEKILDSAYQNIVTHK